MIFGSSTTRLFDLLQSQAFSSYSLQSSLSQRNRLSSSQLIDQSNLAKVRTQLASQASKISTLQKASGVVDQTESSISSLESIVSQLRELAEDATDENLTADERNNLEAQAKGLLQEFDTISKSSKFGSQNLLDGSFQALNLGGGLRVSLSNISAANVGRITSIRGDAGAIAPSSALSNFSNYTKINGVFISRASSDGVSTRNSNYSAISIANAVNEVKDRTGVEAKALSTEKSLFLDLTSFSKFSGNTSFSGNDIKINNVSIEGDISSASKLVDKINEQSSLTGVTAELVTNQVILRAEDGRNIEFSVSNSSKRNAYLIFNHKNNERWFNEGVKDPVMSTYTVPESSEAIHAIASGSIELVSSRQIVISGNYSKHQLGLKSGIYGVRTETGISNLDFSSVDSARKALISVEAAETEISKLKNQVNTVQSRIDIRSASLLSSNEALKNYADDFEKSRKAYEALQSSPVEKQQARVVARLFMQSMSSLQVGSVLKNLQSLFEQKS